MALNWEQEIRQELRNAESARKAGKEGRARVCARRAAGIAIREYFSQQGRSISTTSAIRLLQMLMELPGLSVDLRGAAAHLTLHVNEEFSLPAAVDLIAEARRLCHGLLPDWKDF